MPLPIEDYALIGDTATAALVGRDGSIDWLCLPRFDSAACFAAPARRPEHGRWLLGPVRRGRARPGGTSAAVRVLETTPPDRPGMRRVTDVMPIDDGRADLVRRVEGVGGTVRMRHEWIVRFGYGRIRPWVRREPQPRRRGDLRRRGSRPAGPARTATPGRRRTVGTSTSSTCRR